MLFFSFSACNRAALECTVAMANAEAAAEICPKRAACLSNRLLRSISCCSSKSPVDPGTISAIFVNAWSATSAAVYAASVCCFFFLPCGTSISIVSVRVSAARITLAMCAFWFSATDSAVITAASAARRVCSSWRRCRASACAARSRSRRISRRRSATAPRDARISASINAVMASAPESSVTASYTARDASGDALESRESRESRASPPSIDGGTFSSPPNTSSMVSARGRWRPEPRDEPLDVLPEGVASNAPREDEGRDGWISVCTFRVPPASRGVAFGGARFEPRGFGLFGLWALVSSSSSSLLGMDGGGGEGAACRPY